MRWSLKRVGSAIDDGTQGARDKIPATAAVTMFAMDSAAHADTAFTVAAFAADIQGDS
jgi:hypothetical protein